MSNYLDELNDSQREAVTYCDGPSLVIAGAGSGKTRVLTYKIAYLMEQGLAPWHILALTFTNKAAREMKERIARLVGAQQAAGLWMGTFHSIFARILQANGFEPLAVICKVAGKAKSSIGIPQACESIGAAMCNPILQARLLNEAQTDLNVVIGLCVGHDSLFYKYSEAYATTLVTKDRVTGNNPAAALYTAESYYRKKFGLER